LWIPLFYLFWSSLLPERNTGLGGILALIFGSITAFILFFLGAFIRPGGFGYSRWVSGFVDIVSLPALLPLFFYILFTPLKISKNFANFGLLWLIPDAVIKIINYGNNPIMLVLVPLLQTFVVVGISFCMNLIASKKILAIIPALPLIPALPIIAATSYWAFFSHDSVLGYILCVLASIPTMLAIIVLIIRQRA